MKLSEKISKAIDDCYNFRSFNPKDDKIMNYEVLKFKHSKIILALSKYWNDVKDGFPNIGDRVFTITDMRSFGKGVFIGEYFYNAHGFVSEMCYDDAYGFITHWISFDMIDKLETNPLNIGE